MSGLTLFWAGWTMGGVAEGYGRESGGNRWFVVVGVCCAAWNG